MAIGPIFLLLNIGGINSQIIYSENTENQLDRGLFLRELALELMKPQAQIRRSVSNLPLKLRNSVKQLVGVEEENQTNMLQVLYLFM